MGPRGSFLHVLMTQRIWGSFPLNGGLKVVETQFFFFCFFSFLLDFQNFFPRRREGGGVSKGGREKPGGPREIHGGIKNLKATPLVSIKGPVDEETKICS